MPIVTVMMVEGRPDESRRAMQKEVAEAIHRTIGVPIDTIRVILQEVPPTNWSVGGIPKA
ncbi:2-hydroxymuconate tautomerase [Sphingobium subterraneum]|uniref:4-oxalocrotonate tautomerase n=1 Tax=Sphingobium subterraneum TaxID=627688 RepID=A0A841IWP1_9SPHN|nr:2-hydroxymuconate tautomerase [Sphingobium subterraneum]MBB6123073.1 4-oxalocrotonate tautomerase [Sphingobium subterraneum]